MMALAEISLAEGIVPDVMNLLTGNGSQARSLRDTGVSRFPIYDSTITRAGATFGRIVALLTQNELTEPPDSGISIDRRDHDGGILAPGTAAGEYCQTVNDVLFAWTVMIWPPTFCFGQWFAI